MASGMCMDYNKLHFLFSMYWIETTTSAEISLLWDLLKPAKDKLCSYQHSSKKEKSHLDRKKLIWHFVVGDIRTVPARRTPALHRSLCRSWRCCLSCNISPSAALEVLAAADIIPTSWKAHCAPFNLTTNQQSTIISSLCLPIKHQCIRLKFHYK